MKNLTSDVRLDVKKSDQRGRLPMFLLEEKKWVWRYPVDIREAVALGLATVEETELTGPMPVAR